ncbi:MAG: DUF3048 domain-containing protein [Lachnospiraceae bacterium]|nr:DUF3048 domain-containing protein [Lachnospiraceae bacterium]
MKKAKAFALLALVAAFTLSGCGKEKPENGETNVIEPVIREEADQPGQPPAGEDPADTSDAETPPAEGMVRSRITNEWVDEKVDAMRPIAVMIPNSRTASQFGISKASVLYEVNVEGDMTRLMAVIEDWKDLEKIGNIRSIRDYYVFWGFEWDPIFIHYGGPFYINAIIDREDTQNINCLSYNDASFRDQAKDATDNAFTSADRIRKAADHLGYPLEYRKGYADERHYAFSPEDSPNLLTQYQDSFEAKKIDLSKAYPNTNAYFLYNEETGLYERYQHLPKTEDGPHIDLMNDEQLTFKNVIVQNTYYEKRDSKGYLAFQCHDTTRDGWYFTNGRGVHVTWKKESDYGATRYYDDDGKEMLFNTGKTMVLIVEDGDAVLVDERAYSSGAGN